MKNARNVAIILAIAAAVYFIPGGGRASEAVEAALWAAFALGIAALALRAYRERQLTLMSLGDRHRGLLYGAIALGAWEYAAQKRMWETGIGELGWLALLALDVWALMEVFRHSRSY